jgi:UDP-glucose 4-epimerase
MKKVLITGGAGFIASHIADKLIEQGHKVVIIDNLSTGKKEINKNNDNFNKNSIFKYYIEGFDKETASNKIVSNYSHL